VAADLVVDDGALVDQKGNGTNTTEDEIDVVGWEVVMEACVSGEVERGG